MSKLEIINPHVEFVTNKRNSDWYNQALLTIEECGRVSHKSEGRIKLGSAEPFIRKIAIEWKHESILEHASFTACLIGSRSASHQIVRHRIASYTQESQRYCDYSKEGTPKLKIIIPPSIGTLPSNSTVQRGAEHIVVTDSTSVQYVEYSSILGRYLNANLAAYSDYLKLRTAGVKAEDARELLPNATKTEIYVTMNIRAWRHFFHMRMDSHAQWQIKQLAQEVFNHFKKEAPLFVENLATHSGTKL